MVIPSKVCQECNKKFNQTHHLRKFCSQECIEVSNKKSRKKYRQSSKGKANDERYHKSEKFKKVQKKFRESDKGKQYHKEYSKTEKFKVLKKKYTQSPKGRAIQKNYNQKRKENGLAAKYRRAYEANRKKTDPVFNLATKIRKRLLIFLQARKMTKSNTTFDLVGCTPEFLKEYLEKQFKPGMTWDNHTKDGWHIDHRTALGSAKNEEDVKRLCHYTNLQPLWAEENLKKGNK